MGRMEGRRKWGITFVIDKMLETPCWSAFIPGGDSCGELTNNLTSIYLNFNNDDGELSRKPNLAQQISITVYNNAVS